MGLTFGPITSTGGETLGRRPICDPDNLEIGEGSCVSVYTGNVGVTLVRRGLRGSFDVAEVDAQLPASEVLGDEGQLGVWVAQAVERAVTPEGRVAFIEVDHLVDGGMGPVTDAAVLLD